MSTWKQPTPAQINASKLFRGFAGPDSQRVEKPRYDGAASAMPEKTKLRGPDAFHALRKKASSAYHGSKK